MVEAIHIKIRAPFITQLWIFLRQRRLYYDRKIIETRVHLLIVCGRKYLYRYWNLHFYGLRLRLLLRLISLDDLIELEIEYTEEALHVEGGDLLRSLRRPLHYRFVCLA